MASTCATLNRIDWCDNETLKPFSGIFFQLWINQQKPEIHIKIEKLLNPALNPDLIVFYENIMIELVCIAVFESFSKMH